jgi:alkanesulfonate monooxygenase SsuD/methylene tetrahydromethanopterin reductase-like flavin-dependent oxidoreductase (luciferase family)
MTRPDIRFHVLVLPNAPWDDIIARVRHVEELGFDLVAIADHFVDWLNPSLPWLECWTLLAAVAHETTRIRIGTHITQFPLRNPALLARQALTVDQISGGRLELGLGTGLAIDPAYDMMGIPNWEAGERVARFKEYVEIVDLLLSNETASYAGTYYQIQDAVMNPRPIQRPRPPILIAALGPVMLKFAAAKADVWNSISFAETFDGQLEETRQRIRLIDDTCSAIGRDPTTLRRSFQMLDPGSRASGGAVAYFESPQAFVDQAQRVIDLGISEIGLYYPTRADQRAAFEEIATTVIPALKGA